MEDVLNVQSNHNVSSTGTDAFVNIAKKVKPEAMSGISHRFMLNIVKRLSLPNVRQVDVCRNDCIMFRKSIHHGYDYSTATECPVCGEDRWEKEGVSIKVYRYVPLSDLMDMLFCQDVFVQTFVRTDDGGLPHGGDADAMWRDIYDSQQWERKVHGVDPTFGQSVSVYKCMHHENCPCSMKTIKCIMKTIQFSMKTSHAA